jgi:hypothetical protein
MAMSGEERAGEAGIPPEELPAYRDWQARVAGANIDPKTLLATDYLNHFNEMVMLIDMIPDMPDMIEDVKQWAPRDYRADFEQSTFAARHLAIEAYEHAPAAYRRPFEETVRQLDQLLLGAVRDLDERIAEGAAEDALRDRVQAVCRAAQRLIEVASGIIHGSTRVLDQEEIDHLLF